MKIIQRYIVKYYILDSEEIIIAQYPNGKYYIHYGWIEEKQCGTIIAGNFKTFAEAEKTMKRHRPTAEKKDAIEPDYQWIAIVKDENGKIRIFSKRCDKCSRFLYEVRGWNAGDIIAVYRSEDIEGITNL